MKNFFLYLLRAIGMSFIDLATMLLNGELKSDLVISQEALDYAGCLPYLYLSVLVGNYCYGFFFVIPDHV